MKNPQETGICHICGQDGELTYEHVPPRGAYNKRPILVAYGRQLFEGRGIDDLDKKKQQRGAGDYTLCGQCNNDTGAWYASTLNGCIKRRPCWHAPKARRRCFTRFAFTH